MKLHLGEIMGGKAHKMIIQYNGLYEKVQVGNKRAISLYQAIMIMYLEYLPFLRKGDACIRGATLQLDGMH